MTSPMSNPRPAPEDQQARIAAIRELLEELADTGNWVSAIAPMGDAVSGWCGTQEPMVWQRARRLLDALASAQAAAPSTERPETGPMQFGDDWPGVFIRGDNALHFAMELRGVLAHLVGGRMFQNPITLAVLDGLADTLAGCDARVNPKAQKAIVLPEVPHV